MTRRRSTEDRSSPPTREDAARSRTVVLVVVVFLAIAALWFVGREAAPRPLDDASSSDRGSLSEVTAPPDEVAPDQRNTKTEGAADPPSSAPTPPDSTEAKTERRDLSLRVVDEARVPVGGARVSIQQAFYGRETGHTADDGTVTLSIRDEPQSVHVVLSAEGYEMFEKQFLTLDQVPTELVMNSAARVCIHATRTLSITVEVDPTGPGEPATTRDGSLSLGDVLCVPVTPPYDVSYRVSAPGWPPHSGRVILSSGETHDVDYPPRDALGSGVSVRVLDPAGNGVLGAKVVVISLRFGDEVDQTLGETDEHGELVSTLASEGVHTFEVRTDRYPARRVVTTGVESTVVVQLEEPATLRVVVVTPAGEVAQRGQVNLGKLDGRLTLFSNRRKSIDNGEAVFEKLEGGRYAAFVHARDIAAFCEVVTVEPGVEKRVELRAPIPLSITGHVLCNGEPLPRGEVRFRSADGTSRWPFQRDGSFRADVPSDAYAISVYWFRKNCAVHYELGVWELDSDEHLDLAFDAVDLTFRAIHPDGWEIPGLMPLLRCANGRSNILARGAKEDKEVVVENVPVGTWFVGMSTRSSSYKQAPTVEIEAKENAVITIDIEREQTIDIPGLEGIPSPKVLWIDAPGRPQTMPQHSTSPVSIAWPVDTAGELAIESQHNAPIFYRIEQNGTVVPINLATLDLRVGYLALAPTGEPASYRVEPIDSGANDPRLPDAVYWKQRWHTGSNWPLLPGRYRITADAPRVTVKEVVIEAGQTSLVEM